MDDSGRVLEVGYSIEKTPHQRQVFVPPWQIKILSSQLENLYWQSATLAFLRPSADIRGNSSLNLGTDCPFYKLKMGGPSLNRSIKRRFKVMVSNVGPICCYMSPLTSSTIETERRGTMRSLNSSAAVPQERLRTISAVFPS